MYPSGVARQILNYHAARLELGEFKQDHTRPAEIIACPGSTLENSKPLHTHSLNRGTASDIHGLPQSEHATKLMNSGAWC